MLSDNWWMMAGYTYVDTKYRHNSNKTDENKPFDAAESRRLLRLATSYAPFGELYRWCASGDLATQNKAEDSNAGFQQSGYTIVDAILGYKVSERIDT